MKGKPKYKLGDKVKFTLQNKEYEGTIEIIDAYGTWDDPSDVSYDIMVDNWEHPNTPGKLSPCLFKHITEKEVDD